MANDDAMVLIFARNAFYRRLYYLALGAFGLSLIAIVFLTTVIVFLKRHPVHPLYFATDNVGRLIQIDPVSKPNLTKEEIVSWVKEAITASFSYDYINYPGQLQAAQKYFTSYGWRKYMQTLTISGNLRALMERKYVVNAQATQMPRLLREGKTKSGIYSWEYEMPLLITYLLPPYDGSVQFTNTLKVSVIIQRQPALQGYKGLGIVQMVASRMDA